MLRARFVEGTLARCWRWAAAAVLGVAAANASAYTVSLTPATQTVSLGTEVVVDLVLTDLGPDGLGSFDFNLTYDAALLGYRSFVDGAVLGLSVGLSVLETGNVLTVSDFSIDDPTLLLAAQQGAGASITLATLRFGTLGAGIAQLALSNAALADVFGGLVAFTQNDAEVVITEPIAVPVPGTAALLLAAAFAAATARRRTRV